MALLVHGYYIFGVTNFGDFVSGLTIPLSLRALFLMGGLIECVIQLFYAWRIYQFGRLTMGRAYIPSFIVAVAFAHLAVGIVVFVDTIQYPNYEQAPNLRMAIISCFSLSAVCDLTITASMVYYLRTRCTLVKRTIAAITTLVYYSIITGALALMFSILSLFTNIRWPHTLIPFLFYITTVHVYVCAFMAILNSRDGIRTKLAAQSENGHIITPIRFRPDPNPGGNSADHVTSIVTRVVDQSTSESGITLPKNFEQVKDENTPPYEV